MDEKRDLCGALISGGPGSPALELTCKRRRGHRGQCSVEPPPPYDPPKVTPIGNARDLLAGGQGSITDAHPVPGMPRQSGGGS